MPLKDPEARRIYHREYMKARYNNDPVHKQKQLVRVKTKYADVPEGCSACGAPNPEAHHEDYAKPDERRWLCRDCHRAEHPNEC